MRAKRSKAASATCWLIPWGCCWRSPSPRPTSQNGAGGKRLLSGLKPLQPRLALIGGDGGYSGEEFTQWCSAEGGWRLEIIKRNDSAEGFVMLPWRWIVERTIAWIDRFRRLCKDYERKVQTSEYLIEAAMIRLMLRRLTR